jgi:hypothetical protein
LKARKALLNQHFGWITWAVLAAALAGCAGSELPAPAFDARPTLTRAAVSPSPSTAPDSAVTRAPRVTVAPDIYDLQGERYEEGWGYGWSTSPAFLVVTEDRDKAAKALGRAATRFSYVGDSGKELTLAELEGENPEYTPNYVSEVYLTDLGPMIWADTKGELTKGMGEGMLGILVAELRSEEITAFVTAPPADLSLEGVPRMEMHP